VGLWAFSALSSFLFLILLSWLFAIAMEPAIARLCERGMRRGTATGLVGGAALLLTATLAVVFGNLFLQQASALVQALPDVVTKSVEWLNRTFHLSIDAATVTDRLKLNSDQLTTLASNLAGGFFGVVTSLVKVVFDGFTFVVFAFYLAADGPRIRQTIGSWLTPARQEVFVTVWDIAVAKTGGYVVSKVVLAIASAFLHGAVFWFIGVPYWLPLALLAGITAQFIPVVGTYIGVVVPVLFVVFSSPLTAVWIVVFAAVYQQVETYVFTPRISRRTMDVNSGIALAAVFVGAAFWGPIGALIGIPLVAAVVAVVQTYGHRYELVPALQGLPVPADGEPDEVTGSDRR
jgi:predicted PurR-regulated permease PerM